MATEARRRFRHALFASEHFQNREGRKDFNFVLRRRRTERGVSLLVRVRNEGTKIRHCLLSVLALVNEVVVIDNGSTDGTRTIVETLQRHEKDGHKIRIFSYPFSLARFGPEHDRTPEDSLHSAAYYSNWGIAQCAFRYVCKWDGDMVLTKEARGPFERFLSQIQDGPRTCWTFPGQTVYRDVDGLYYLATGEINREVMIFPYGFNPRFHHVQHWEGLQSRPALPIRHFEPVTFYELKFVDEDEFSHWSTTNWPSERKKQEWSNFCAVQRKELSATRFMKLPPTFLDEQLP